MVKAVVVVLVFGLLLVGSVGLICADSFGEITKEDIEKAERLYEESLGTQLPIEEQIKELGRIEIKLYGKEVTDYDAIRNK